MSRSRVQYQMKEVVAVANQSKDTKPDVSLLDKKNFENAAEIPCKRRYFRAARQAKAKQFIEKATKYPETYGIVGTTVWFEGLLKEIDEPGVITMENVRHWMKIRPVLFNAQAELSQQRESANRFRTKKDIKMEQELTDDSSNDLFDALELKRCVIVEPEPFKEADTALTCVDDAEVRMNGNEHEIQPTDHKVDISESSIPLMELECETVDVNYSAIANKDQYLQIQDNDYEHPHAGDEVKEVNTETTEMSIDSGVQSSEQYFWAYSNNSSFIGTQVFAVNCQDFTELTEASGSYKITQSPITPNVFHYEAVRPTKVPDANLTKLPDNLSEFERVMEMLNRLVDAFEKWHEFPMEAKQPGCYKMFKDLRKTLEDLENGCKW